MDAIQQLTSTFTQRMEAFENQLKKGTGATSPPDIISLAADFASFKDFVMKALYTLQEQSSLLSRSVEQLEMRSRKKFLLVHGVPEVNQEDTCSVLVKIIVNKMKLDSFQTSDINHCYRLGKPNGDKPRPILVKMCDMAVRKNVWFAKTNLKGSGVTLSEFLTKARHDLFMQARKKFGVSKCWTREGDIYVMGTDGLKQRIECQQDLASLDQQVTAPDTVKESGVSVPKMRRAASKKK